MWLPPFSIRYIKGSSKDCISFLITESSADESQSLEFTWVHRDVLLQIISNLSAFFSVNISKLSTRYIYIHIEMAPASERTHPANLFNTTQCLLFPVMFTALQGTKFDFFGETWNLQENDLPGRRGTGTWNFNQSWIWWCPWSISWLVYIMLQSHCCAYYRYQSGDKAHLQNIDSTCGHLHKTPSRFMFM